MDTPSITPHFVYFGGEPLGAPILEILLQHGYTPELVVTSPDRKSGRGQKVTFPPVKELALSHNLPVFQPESLKDKTALTPLTEPAWDLFIVVAYNHILPEWLIELPTHDTLNVHPSLLPALRGPSPIRTALLEDQREAVGVSIMQMDKEMDHGPIVAQEPYTGDWPLPGRELDHLLSQQGGRLLATSIAPYLAGTCLPTAQEHEQATYTKKFTKEDSALNIDPHQLPTGAEANQVYLKICAFDGNPGTYFRYKGKRIKIQKAKLTRNPDQLHLVEVIPEGKPAILFDIWLQSQSK